MFEDNLGLLLAEVPLQADEILQWAKLAQIHNDELHFHMIALEYLVAFHGELALAKRHHLPLALQGLADLIPALRFLVLQVERYGFYGVSVGVRGILGVEDMPVSTTVDQWPNFVLLC